MILEAEDVLQADVYISPPSDGLESAEDSSDENSATVDNMTGIQLSATFTGRRRCCTSEMQVRVAEGLQDE